MWALAHYHKKDMDDDAWMLFKLPDEGCMRLRGTAKAIDVANIK